MRARGRSSNRLGLTVDVFNALNRSNFSRYDTGFRGDPANPVTGTPAKPNPDFGRGTELASDARRYQLGLELNF